MKYCPSCGTQYTDDTLRFCLQDGSQLNEVREAETPTVVLDETPTVTRHRVPSPSYETNPEASVSEESAGKKRSIVIPVVIVAAPAAVLFTAGALVTWMYLSGPRAANRNDDLSTVPSPSQRILNGSPSPKLSETPLSKRSPSPSATSEPLDRERAEREVSDTIESWRTQTESLDLNSYMENYAAKIDYYNRRGVDKSFVRNDKARAFGSYRSIDIEVENMNISVEDTGDLATARFDKEWEFRADRSSSGKVRSELRLRREGGRWLIVGERDIKAYYVN